MRNVAPYQLFLQSFLLGHGGAQTGRVLDLPRDILPRELSARHHRRGVHHQSDELGDVFGDCCLRYFAGYLHRERLDDDGGGRTNGKDDQSKQRHCPAISLNRPPNLVAFSVIQNR